MNSNREKNMAYTAFIYVFSLVMAIVTFFSDNALSGQGETGPAVAATVHTAIAHEQVVRDVLMAYGRITPAPGNTISITIPFECRIEKSFVTQGQQVEQGMPLVEIAPSPSSLLIMQSAENDLKAAKQQLDKVRERKHMKLATAAEMIQAQKEYDLAMLRMKNLKSMKMAEKLTINAENNGMVTRLYCRAGQIITSGSPLMDIVYGNRLEAAIGVEPHDMHWLKSGQEVMLVPVNRDMSKKTGTIRTVSHAVNSSSRLIDVFVSLPLDSNFLLNEFVRAEIVLDTRKGIVVPRSAVIPDGNGSAVCFTVEHGRACRHVVKTGWQDRDSIEIYSRSIKAGDEVVILGNYELNDNMPVRIIRKENKLSISSKTTGWHAS